MLCGVILAGGLSERFGCDKYLWKVNDKPIISIVAFALREVSDKIYLLTRDKTRAIQLSEITGVEDYILDDVNINCGGPLRGLLTALLKIDSEEYLVIPGDLPWIDSSSLKRLVERCRDSEAECGSIVWGDGSLSSTIQYFNSDAKQYLSDIVELRGIYGRATDTFRSCRRVLLTHVSNVVDEPKKLVGVNFQKDLINPYVPPIHGFIDNDIYIKRNFLNFLAAVKFESIGDLEKALKMYLSEVKEYLDLNIYHLALHALIDAKRCSSIGETEIDKQIMECASKLGWNKVKRHIPK